MKFIATALLVGLATLMAYGFGFYFFLYVGLAFCIFILGTILWFSNRH